jgi:2,4-dienoyl-CoA reductase-like NADH-dependent reductase (Old Yellow Enzyme family)
MPETSSRGTFGVKLISEEGCEVKDLFEETRIGSLSLQNRFVRSATWEGMAQDDGAVTEKLIAVYSRLAEGKVGLIDSSFAYVNPQGKAVARQMGLYKDELISGYKRLTNEVHKQGSKVFAQIMHGGALSLPIKGQKPKGPSTLTGGQVPSQEMTREEITQVIKDFSDAAIRAKKAGFDGVQIHACHGYLPSEFLSPYFNLRTDEYGGSPENRARMILEAYDGVRSSVGKEFPVSIKINCEDFLERGLKVDDCAHACRRLAEKGIDAIELSGGTSLTFAYMRLGVKTPAEEAYFYPYAKKVKEGLSADVPLILVGGLRSLEVMKRILSEGIVDYFALSRPLVREPDLIKRWQSGDHSKAQCGSCNGCLQEAARGELYCGVKRKEEKKKEQAC